LSVLGDTDIVGKVQLGNTLSVLGDTDIVGKVQLGNTLSVTGNTKLNTLSVTGNTEIGGTLSVFGVLDVEGNTTDKDLHIGNISSTTTQYGLTFNKNLSQNNPNKVFFFEENGQLIIAKEENYEVVRKHIFR
jgi:hypothetical protein